jgi:hypothetical protein
MVYRITKDCGTGWDEMHDGFAETAWGVSERQRPLAEKVRPGDVFLHYIDRVHAWAGYSEVTGILQINNRDSHPDWVDALPGVIPIAKGRWLTEAQCEHTVRIPALSEKHYERQVAFTAVDPEEARIIIAAIDGVPDIVKEQSSQDFHALWIEGAGGYYKDIVKGQANGKCRLCGEDGVSWAAKLKLVGLEVGEQDKLRIANSFLDAAHIVPNSILGPVEPDNLRALYPNCHRVVDRLPRDQSESLLRGI